MRKCLLDVNKLFIFICAFCTSNMQSQNVNFCISEELFSFLLRVSLEVVKMV